MIKTHKCIAYFTKYRWMSEQSMLINKFGVHVSVADPGFGLRGGVDFVLGMNKKK